LRGGGPKNFTVVCYRGLPPTAWQVRSSYVVLSACVKPGNEEKRKILGGWVKTPVPFLLLVHGSKFMKFLDDVGDRSSCSSLEILSL